MSSEAYKSHENNVRVKVLLKLRTIVMGHDKLCSQRDEMNSNRFTVEDADTIGQLSSLTLHLVVAFVYAIYTIQNFTRTLR